MTRPVINIDDAEFTNWGHGGNWPGMKPPQTDRFQARLAPLGARVGAQKLGYTFTVVPPGKRAFPVHSHRANEEMFFIVEGEGEARIGDATYPLRRGDVVACPPGGPETAHQIVNTSTTTELKYLAVSTKISPEMTEYPDSGKFAVMVDLPPGADGKPRRFRHIDRPGEDVGYWDGES